MGDAEVIRILLEYSDMLTPSNIFYFVLRFLGWGLIKLLGVLVNSAQGVLDEIMKYLSFFDNSIVNNIIDKIKPIAVAFLAMSLLYIAYQVMINRRKFDVSRIPINVITAVLIIFFLPTAMNSLAQLTQEGFNMFKSENTMIASEIISSNIADIYLYDKNNFTNKNIEPKNTIDRNKVTKIDPTEEVDRSKVKNKEVFENKIIPAIGEEGYELKKINGWFKIDSEYYRWDINFFQIIATLLISGMVLIFTMIKIVKLMFELAFSKIFIIGGAFADLSYGQKTKQMLMHIISIYIAIISVGLTLQLYILGTAWLNDRIGGFANIMINLGAALFVIDGPNLLEKIFGVDAGLSSGLRVLMGINSGLDIAQKVGNGLSTMANVGKKGLEAGAILGAGAMGFRNGTMPDIEDEINNESGINPFKNSLHGGEDMKLLGEGNNDDDVFKSSDTPDTPTPDGMLGGDFSNVNGEELSNDLLDDNSLEDIYSKDIQGLNDDIDSGGVKSNDNFTNGNEILDDLNSTGLILEDDTDSSKAEGQDVNRKRANGNKILNKENGILEDLNIANLSFDDENSSDMESSFRANLNNNSVGSGNMDLSGNIHSDRITGIDTSDDVGSYHIGGDSRLDSDMTSSSMNRGTDYQSQNGLERSGGNRNWEYGKEYSGNPGERINLGFTPKWRPGVHDEPKYIDPNETRNIKDMLQGAMSSKINSMKNSDLANRMSTSYKIGNNTAKDIRRYVGIKEAQLQDKIVEAKVKRDMRRDER